MKDGKHHDLVALFMDLVDDDIWGDGQPPGFHARVPACRFPKSPWLRGGLIWPGYAG